MGTQAKEDCSYRCLDQYGSGLPILSSLSRAFTPSVFHLLNSVIFFGSFIAEDSEQNLRVHTALGSSLGPLPCYRHALWLDSAPIISHNYRVLVLAPGADRTEVMISTGICMESQHWNTISPFKVKIQFSKHHPWSLTFPYLDIQEPPYNWPLPPSPSFCLAHSLCPIS